MKTKSGWARLDGRDHGRPVVGVRPRAGALAPRALEGVVHHQHRHVAAHAVALRGDRPQRLDHGAAQIRREGVQLHDVRPGREVRVAAVGEDAAADPDERGRVAREVVLVAGDEVLGVRRASTGGRAQRGSARSRGSAASPRSRERRARGREARPGRRGARRPCSRGCSTASRRRPRVGSRAARAGSSRSGPRSRARSRSPPGCAPRRPSARPRRSRALRSRPTRCRERWPGRPARPLAAAQLVEPDPGVDLVDERVLGQHAARGQRGRVHRTAAGCGFAHRLPVATVW